MSAESAFAYLEMQNDSVRLTIPELLKSINAARLAASGGWWQWESDDGNIRIKGYGTWCQRILISRTTQGRPIQTDTPPDVSVSMFKKSLADVLCFAA